MNLPPIKYISTGPMAPEASISAATAPAQGMMEVGKALGETGEKLFRVAEQLRESEEAKIRSDLFNQIEGEAGKFKDALLRRSDYGKWGEEFDAKARGWEAMANEKGLSPAGKAIFTQQYSEWRSRTRIGIETNAAMKAITDGRIAAANTVQRGIDTRDRETVRRGVAELRRNGASPAEISKVEYGAEGAINRGLIGDMIESDPSGWAERLDDPDELRKDYPGISNDDIKDLKRQAESRTQDLRGEVMDGLDVKAMQNKLTQDDINNAPHLSDKDRQIYSQRLEDDTPPDAQTVTNAWKLTDALRAHRMNPDVTQEEYRHAYNETKAAVMEMIPLNHQGDIRRELGYLTPAGRDADTPTGASGPLTREDILAEARAQIARALDGDQLGKSGDDATPAEREEANRKAGHLRLGAKRYLSSLDPNDPETPRKVQEFLDGKISGKANISRGAGLEQKVPGLGGGMRTPRPPVPVHEAEGVLPKLKATPESLEEELNKAKGGKDVPEPQPPDYIR